MKKLCAQILSRYEALWDCGRARTICERNIMKKVYRSETVNKLFFSGKEYYVLSSKWLVICYKLSAKKASNNFRSIKVL